MIKVYGYTKCSTVKKALKFLQSNNIDFEHIDNIQNPLTIEQLTDIINKSNLEIKKFFNTSGIKYRELKLKDKIPNLSKEECIELLATDGMLVKRPLLVSESKILVGFKEDQWLELLA